MEKKEHKMSCKGAKVAKGMHHEHKKEHHKKEHEKKEHKKK